MKYEVSILPKFVKKYFCRSFKKNIALKILIIQEILLTMIPNETMKSQNYLKNILVIIIFSKLKMIFVALCAFLILLHQADAGEKCRALVLQGGGDKGAYQAGVLYGLVTYTDKPEEFQYDVLTGISVGAVNAISLAQFPKGEEKEAVQYLKDIWANTTRKDIYKSWPGGIIEGLFFKPSLFNSHPERFYIEKYLKTFPDKRQVTVVATDMNTGKKVSFNENTMNGSLEDAINTAMYSSAVPFVFEPQPYLNNTLIDGGWSGEGLDVEDAVARCREIVEDDKDIILDIIFANNISNIRVKRQNYTSLQILARYSQILSYTAGVRAYEYAIENYPDVNFRYVMIASQKLPNQDIPLDFNPKNIEFMLNLGIQDAKEALEQGPELGKKRIEQDIKRLNIQI